MKSCPFCDTSDKAISVVIVDQAQNWHAAHCSHCGAYGPSAGRADDAERYWDERIQGDPSVAGPIAGLMIFWLIIVAFGYAFYTWLR